jgi:hypothetical protein
VILTVGVVPKQAESPVGEQAMRISGCGVVEDKADRGAQPICLENDQVVEVRVATIVDPMT